MSGTTTHGWPYVTPDDHPLQFPAASQVLAEKLEGAVPQILFASLSVAAAGMQIVFSKPFATPPAVTAAARTYSDQIATISNVTATGFMLYLKVGWGQNAGLGVADAASWIAVGTAAPSAQQLPALPGDEQPVTLPADAETS